MFSPHHPLQVILSTYYIISEWWDNKYLIRQSKSVDISSNMYFFNVILIYLNYTYIER